MLRFLGGHSFTGEATVEFQCHGSVAVVKSVLAELAAQPGLRLAEPGEFTRRALINGRLDLTQVEGLADLIEAETEAQRVQAQRVLTGEVGDLVSVWRQKLLRAAALLAVSIDFSDEDVPDDVTEDVVDSLNEVRQDLARQLAGFSAAERVRNGFEIAIVGAPNVGKSTLLNYLAGRDAAITSEIAGTTRDVIEVKIDLQGLAVTFLDTAGIRETDDQIERIGVERARFRAAAADLRIFLLDGEMPDVEVREGDIIRYAKGDLTGRSDGISGLSGLGVSVMLEEIQSVLLERVSGAGLVARERHKACLETAISAIDGGLEMLKIGAGGYEFAAENIRIALHGLEELLGRVGVEEILGEIFASFCLGK